MGVLNEKRCKRWKKGGRLDRLHTHSVQQAVRQVSQKGIKK